MRLALPLLLLSTLVAPLEAQVVWRDVSLAEGLVLDLAEGRSRTGAALEEGTLALVEGRLVAQPPLAAWRWPGPEGISPAVVRGAGELALNPEVQAGAEFLFELEVGGWGYVRILHASAARVELEYARAPYAMERLERDPPVVQLNSSPLGHRLSWVAEDGAQYRIERRAVGGVPEAVEVGRVEGGSWLDEEPPAGQLVEYTVARVDARRGFGSRARGVRTEHPGEWPLELSIGARLDLLTGELGGSSPHVEVVQLAPPNITLRALEGVLLSPAPYGRAVTSWVAPGLEANTYSDKLRSSPLQGEQTFYLTSEGVFGRLTFELSPGAVVHVRRQLDLMGGRVLPRPPRLEAATWYAGTLSVRADAVSELDAPDSHAVQLVVEVEQRFQSGVWEELAAGAPGERMLSLELQAAPGELPLRRLRLRNRYPFGPRSHGSQAERILLLDVHDSGAVDAVVEQAFNYLGDDAFERRRAARGTLSELGELAWPRLREALASDVPELARAAREVLLGAAEEEAVHLEFVFRAYAAAEGVSEEPPPGIFDERAGRRALALLRAWQSPAAQAWAGILQRADPDPAVAQLAELRLKDGSLELTAPWPASPYVAFDPVPLPVDPSLDWTLVVRTHPPAELASFLRDRIDLTRPRIARTLLLLIGRLEDDLSTPQEWRGPDGLGRTAELALRLMDAARGPQAAILLQAAEALVDAPGARLRAERELLEMRLRWSAEAPRARERIVLAEPDFERLAALLGQGSSPDGPGLDIVLAPGDYGAENEDAQSWLDIQRPNVRLIGGPEVRLFCGVRVQNARGVVLEDLRIVHARGSALIVTEAEVALSRCELAGSQTVATVQAGLLEFDTCDLVAAGTANSLYSVRMMTGSELRALGSWFAAGTLYLGDEGSVYLDRCVVDGLSRPVAQGQQSCSFVMRDGLLSGQNMGIYNVQVALLDGVVLDMPQDPFGRIPGSVRICPDHVHVLGKQAAPDGRASLLEACPLDRNR